MSNPYQNHTVWHSCPKVAPKSVASLCPIVQRQLNWRLSQGTRYPKENSNSWNVSEAPTGCEPFTTSSSAEKPPAQHNENIGLCCHLHHEGLPRLLSWRDWMAPGVKYSHSWMWARSEASQRLERRPEPSPGLGGSLFHHQSLHTCLCAWGCPTWSPVRIYGHSIYRCIQEKKNNKKKNSKINKMKVFMGLGGANLEISLAQIELLGRQ